MSASHSLQTRYHDSWLALKLAVVVWAGLTLLGEAAYIGHVTASLPPAGREAWWAWQTSRVLLDLGGGHWPAPVWGGTVADVLTTLIDTLTPAELTEWDAQRARLVQIPAATAALVLAAWAGLGIKRRTHNA